MDTIKREVTPEQYAQYAAMSPGELDSAIEKTLPDSILMGYGYYGAYLSEGRYVNIKTGSSCD